MGFFGGGSIVPEIPQAVCRPSRMGANLSRISNGLSASSASSLASLTQCFSPIYVNRDMYLRAFRYRTSGGASWPNASAVTLHSALYTNGEDNLPDVVLNPAVAAGLPANSDGAITFPVNTGTNTWIEQAGGFNNSPAPDPGLFVTRGIYWVSLVNGTASAVELAGVNTSPLSFSTGLFSQLVGVGATQTSVGVGIHTSVSSNSFGAGRGGEAGTSTRNLDMQFSAGSSTTFRLRSTVPMIWIEYVLP